MPRANRRRRDEPRGARARSMLGAVRSESHADGDWLVRSVRGNDSGKAYRCPGCQQEVPAGTPHVVAWPADGLGGLDARRHWHTPCWRARNRRTPRGSWK